LYTFFMTRSSLNVAQKELVSSAMCLSVWPRERTRHSLNAFPFSPILKNLLNFVNPLQFLKHRSRITDILHKD
jgi:hypothetical protein